MIFWYFNVQLLPVDGKERYVGKEGYKKLFEEVNKVASFYWEKQRLHDIAFVSRKNYLAFRPFLVEDNFASGFVTKFDLIDKVYQTYTAKELFDAKNQPASSERDDFYFYYSFEEHVLAIQKKSNTPSASIVKKMLSRLLREAAEKIHPDYVLEVSMLNDYGLVRELEERSLGYYSAEIHATFTNSWDYVEGEAKELDSELRDKGINRVDHKERAGKNGIMSGLSKFALSLFMISIPSGFANIAYLDSQTGKRERFNTDEKPVSEKVSDKQKGARTRVSREELDRRIDASIQIAIKKSVTSSDNMEKNQDVGAKVLGGKKDGKS